MEQKDIYDEPSKQDLEERHMRNYEIRKRIKEEKYNPCDGNVIKAERCRYKSNKQQTQTDAKKEKSYEDEVNEILEEFFVDEQVNINELVEKEKNLYEILEKNDKQVQVKKMIEDNER